MRLDVISHCALDTVHLEGSVHEQAGGDACYIGKMCREFGSKVELQTRYGKDFPIQYLDDAKMTHEGALSESPTTRFTIHIDGHHRKIYLNGQCDNIPVRHMDNDGTIIAPIYHEISPQDIHGHDGYILLNPQGLIRGADQDGLVTTVTAKLDLKGIDALKVNPAEVKALSGQEGEEGLKLLHKMGAKTIIRTNGENISMLTDNMLYSIRLPNKEIHDTTGLGAILCGAFVCTMLKEKDVLWAFCFAGGAVQAALDTKSLGLLKIPHRGAIQTNASYFYNLVKYKQV